MGSPLSRAGGDSVASGGRLNIRRDSARDTSSGVPRARVSVATIVLIALYSVLALGMAFLSLEPPYVTPWWAMAVLAVGGCVALAARDLHPHVAFVAAMLLSVASLAVGSGAETLLAVIAVFVAGVHRRAATAWLCFVIAVLCGALGALALTARGNTGPPILGLQPPMFARDTVQDWVNYFLVIGVILLIATLLGTNVGHRRRYIGELVHRAEQLARERDQQADTARALERERIAREMHDVIAHSLSVMIAISDGAHAAAGEHPEEAKEAIARVAETGRKTLGEVRRLLGSVRDDRGGSAVEHAPQPDASQITSLVQEFIVAGLPIRLSVTGVSSPDPALGLTVYRIVQESLTNVLRHARDVRSVTVAVTWTAEEVTIVVKDLASAVDASDDTGRGLLGMRERVALYDGVTEAGPHQDGGWRVSARLQLED